MNNSLRLFVQFTRREIRTRYLGSVTGLAWAFLTPLALLAVYNFVFTYIFKARALIADGSFILFLAAALWPWLAAQEAISRGVMCLSGYAGLIRKVVFPHEIAVYAVLAGTFALQIFGYFVVLLVLKALGEPVHLRGLLGAVPVLVVMMIAVTGVTLILAALQVFIRDIEHILPPLLMLLMFLAPILYPMSAVPEKMAVLLSLNPFTWVANRLRDMLILGDLTPHFGDLVALCVAVAVLVCGRAFFLRLSPYFEDFV
ncbi:MAG: ABC transporter permease [Burkholderiales bacterium]|nr:ABC transporter permease [Burkholderiales bacterium]